MGTQDRIRKLRWSCRRGMKELDVLLERFVERNGHQLAEGAWPELENLLQQEDDVLWDWLQNPDQPEARNYRAVLAGIRPGHA